MNDKIVSLSKEDEDHSDEASAWAKKHCSNNYFIIRVNDDGGFSYKSEITGLEIIATMSKVLDYLTSNYLETMFYED